MWAYRETADLCSGTIDAVLFGTFFPFLESETEISNSYILAQAGMYRYAFTALRVTLELGLLSVYWDRSDEAHQEMVAWLRSSERTPSLREIRAGLLQIPAVHQFDAARDFSDRVRAAAAKLNNYVHVRGHRYSTKTMNRANFPRFDADTFRSWCDSPYNVVCLVVTAHLLKYPIGLQLTPMEEKFGLEGPAGGFLTPWQRDEITAVLPADDLRALQEISDSDESAVGLARAIRDRPDLSEGEWEVQIERHDRSIAESQGFVAWHRQWSSIHEDTEHNSPEAIERFRSRAESLRH